MSEQVEKRSEENSARRDFFKSAFMTAAGVAVGSAFVAEGAEAQNTPNIPMRSGHVHVLFSEGKVTSDSIAKSVAQIVTLAGCANCGMVGFDIRFLGGDPVSFDTALLPAVQSIMVTAL